jgi:outer membrane protein TolC
VEIPSVSYDPAVTASMAQTFLGRTWENNPTIQNARDWVKVADLNYKITKHRLYPMFSFAASAAQSNSTNASANTVSQVGVFSTYYGISASWMIFDGRATRAAKISARANQRYYERLLQNQTDAVLDQVRSLEKQLGFSHRAVILAETRNTQAEAAVRQRQDEVQQGLSSQVAVDAALAAQDTYRYYVLNQRLDFLSRWSEFASTVETDPVLEFLPATLKSNVR